MNKQSDQHDDKIKFLGFYHRVMKLVLRVVMFSCLLFMSE